jgi:hypothetical protein
MKKLHDVLSDVLDQVVVFVVDELKYPMDGERARTKVAMTPLRPARVTVGSDGHR